MLQNHATEVELVKWKAEVKKRIESVSEGFRITGWVAAALNAGEDYDVPLAGGVHVSCIEVLGNVGEGVWDGERGTVASSSSTA